ncbi:SHIRT domain-containing protein [Faecalicatena acetigenes]|uniref:SHIRT domain-containing protein n=1 Tax=Faecalicatena acetigenes TaxID=2981790 RepID=A0ABT2TDS8_9FIRM|nr:MULTISPECIES: SHIRT domain-containing protein [Lachnospiraceae]MCU6748443.1 SHIRT domain-containing protein [Faecalicatena acetigenes]SCI44543.1 Bacterial Ig-like domain (group 3) [uncultured Clostridium sp.]
MIQRKLKKKFSMLLALMLTFGTMFSGTMSVHAEEALQEVLSLSFDTDEVKKPVLGDTVPDSFNVQPNDGNSLTDDSEVFLSWRVKQADGTWDYAKPTSETVQFEAGKEYRLRFDIQNLKVTDGKAFPDNVPAVKVNDMNVSVVTDDNVTDSYYTKTDDTTVSFAMYSKSFKIENIILEVPPAETPEKTFIVTKDTDGSEIGRYDTLQETLGAINGDNKDKWNAYTVMVTRDYTEDDRAPVIPMNATVTVTSSPGNQFVITRADPGRAWSSKHFSLGGDASLILKNIILDGNNAMGGIYSDGGVGVHTRATTIILDKGTVIRNCLGRGSDPYTPWSGGAVVTLGNGKGVVTTIKEGARIENCKSSEGYDGGAAYIDVGTQLNVEGGVIEGCEAIGTEVTVGGSTRHSNGGAIMLHGTMNMTGGTISNNKTTASGGGIAVSDTGRLSITGGTIEGNNGAHGGGVFIQESTAETKIENATFTGNQAKYGGGIYLHKNAGINVSNSTFADNFAIQGGAIYTGNSDYGNPADTTKYQTVKLAGDVSFENNSASYGLYTPPENADEFTNLKFSKTSVTGKNIFPVDSLLTNYDINYINGNKVDPTEKYQILFEFKSTTADRDLPSDILDLLPDPISGIKKGDKVTLPIFADSEIKVEDGKWVFTGWKDGTEIVVNDNMLVVGEWKFSPNMSVINNVPTISANDVTLNVGDTFDPLSGVSATDKEDGGITLTKDNIIANDVDTSKAGIYHVTYKVTDKNGASAEKTITVTVKEKTTNKPQQPQKPNKPTKPNKQTKNPKTGDMSNISLFAFMFVGSSGALAVLFAKKRKRNKNV